jgi:hypothetical protein
MRKFVTALLATSMICVPALAWAEEAAPAAPAPTVINALAYPNAPGPDAAAVTPPVAAAPAQPVAEEKEKPSLAENISGTVGGVLGSAAGSAGGPLGSAAAGAVGNKLGRFVGKLFGGKKKPVEAATAQGAAQPASVQVADPIGQVLDQQGQ